MAIFGDSVFNQIGKVKWGPWLGPNPMWMESSWKEIRTLTSTQERSHEVKRKRWPSANQRERPQNEPTLPTPWPWCYFLELWGNKFQLCSAHIYGIYHGSSTKRIQGTSELRWKLKPWHWKIQCKKCIRVESPKAQDKGPKGRPRKEWPETKRHQESVLSWKSWEQSAQNVNHQHKYQ